MHLSHHMLCHCVELPFVHNVNMATSIDSPAKSEYGKVLFVYCKQKGIEQLKFTEEYSECMDKAV